MFPLERIAIGSLQPCQISVFSLSFVHANGDAPKIKR